MLNEDAYDDAARAVRTADLALVHSEGGLEALGDELAKEHPELWVDRLQVPTKPPARSVATYHYAQEHGLLTTKGVAEALGWTGKSPGTRLAGFRERGLPYQRVRGEYLYREQDVRDYLAGRRTHPAPTTAPARPELQSRPSVSAIQGQAGTALLLARSATFRSLDLAVQLAIVTEVSEGGSR